MGRHRRKDATVIPDAFAPLFCEGQRAAFKFLLSRLRTSRPGGLRQTICYHFDGLVFLEDVKVKGKALFLKIIDSKPAAENIVAAAEDANEGHARRKEKKEKRPKHELPGPKENEPEVWLRALILALAEKNTKVDDYPKAIMAAAEKLPYAHRPVVVRMHAKSTELDAANRLLDPALAAKIEGNHPAEANDPAFETAVSESVLLWSHHQAWRSATQQKYASVSDKRVQDVEYTLAWWTNQLLGLGHVTDRVTQRVKQTELERYR